MRALAPTSQLHQGVSAAAPQRGARTIRAPPPAPAARPCRRLARLQRPQLAPAAAGQATAYPAAAQEQDEELALLQSVVEGTELAGASLALVYDAQRDGWSPDAFHAAVDGRGPALVVALTGGRRWAALAVQASCWCSKQGRLPGGRGRCFASLQSDRSPLLLPTPCRPPASPPLPWPAASGALVGGFNPLGWSGAGGEGASEAAFLFYTDEATGELARLAKASKRGGAGGWGLGVVAAAVMSAQLPPASLQALLPDAAPCPPCVLPPPPPSPPQVGGPGGALQRDEPGQGIWFGDALVAPLAPGKERAVKSKLGAFYARKPSGSRHLYAEGAPVKGGARGTELASLQVWVAA